MAYIGAEPLPGQNREVDDISSSFNGSTTAFTLQVNGLNVSPETANNILVNIGGVIQNPGTDYTIAASTITFTTAPASGLSFFAIILGAGINTATVADDTIGASKLIDTAVTAGSYTTADITVDAQGRITAAANGTIAEAEIANNAVTTNKIANEAVTLAKLPHGTSSNDGKFLRANNGADPSFETVTTTTINNNADNRVITGSGTANTLNGEANLTFSSSLLVSDGNGSVNVGGNYILLKRTSGNANYVNAPLADGDLILSADENLLFHTVHTADFNSTERMRLTANGRLLFGHSSSRNIGGHTALFQQEGTTFSNATISITANSADSNGAYLIFGNQRSGSTGGNTIVQSGDEAGTIRFSACDGTDMVTPAAQIRCVIDGTPGSNDMPGRLMFFTTPDGSATTTERMRITSAGNVEIDSFNSPSTRTLSLRTGYAANANGGIGIAANDHSGSAADGLGIFGTDGVSIHTANAGTVFERMRIDTDGRLLHGCTSPSGGATSANFVLEFTSNTTNAIKLRDTHNAGSTNYIMLVGGSAIVGSVTGTTGQAFFNNLSDYRSKENDVKITDGIEKIKLLNPIRFNYKTDPSTLCDGFFAHEVAVAVPSAVTGEKDAMAKIRYEEGDTIPDGKKIGDVKGYSTTEIDPQMLDTGKIIPLLTAALQESIAKIETLETKVAALEAA